MTVTVLQLSDIHLTAQAGGPVLDVDPDARLGQVLAAWGDGGEAADLVVLSGDNTDDGAVDAYRRLAAIEHDGDRYEVRTDGPTGARLLHLKDDGSISSSLLVA